MNSIVSIFRGRKIVIATRHLKERVMAPLFEQSLGVETIVPQGLDTDLLGTFSGEVRRMDDPIVTMRKKCLMAMELTGCDLAVASEGSFGPHPALLFVPADEEKVMLLDRKNGLEIVATEISTETNYSSGDFIDWHELIAFARGVNFPSHGLILRDRHPVAETIVKGLTNEQDLRQAFNQIKSLADTVYAETDMRAMFNPTRMGVIQRATMSLSMRVQSACSRCGAPGFGVTMDRKGLPCELCSKPTRSTLLLIHTCQNCGHTEEHFYPSGKTHENPMYCDFCNP